MDLLRLDLPDTVNAYGDFLKRVRAAFPKPLSDLVDTEIRSGYAVTDDESWLLVTPDRSAKDAYTMAAVFLHGMLAAADAMGRHDADPRWKRERIKARPSP
jgi:hypothetical protein